MSFIAFLLVVINIEVYVVLSAYNIYIYMFVWLLSLCSSMFPLQAQFLGPAPVVHSFYAYLAVYTAMVKAFVGVHASRTLVCAHEANEVTCACASSNTNCCVIFSNSHEYLGYN